MMPDIAEDNDGFMDHDGIPERNPDIAGLTEDASGNLSTDLSSPVVIHKLTKRVEAGKRIPIKAHVYTSKDLRVVATLYRPLGAPNWNVVRMTDLGASVYEGFIPGHSVAPSGLEYCVVAVDETLSGIGYAGLPSMPIRVQVSPNGTPWRILGGVVGASTIGAASYLILRNQE